MGLMKTLTINGKTYALSSVVPASSVTLLADRWVSDGEAYSQVVEVQGVTSCSKVDLQPTPEQLAEFHHKVLGFVAENDYGIVTVYAIGDKPLSDHTIQITLTEVEKPGKIRGNTVGTTMPRANLEQEDPSKADYVLGKESFLKKAVEYVTPQMFGAKGDGVTDDTAAFTAAQESDLPVHVPLGNYVVNNFDFSVSKEWVFQRANQGEWFSGGTTILTSTGITISAGPKIYNLVLKYNGTENIENRPAGVRMKAHFCEIHGLHVMEFYVGMDFGEGAGGHSDYCRIYDLYAWYNYFCGVRLAGGDHAQVNFISFFDCNVGSNGVDVHNRSVEPNTKRGYGFYASLANSVYINNADVSSNETCGIYIDNAVRRHCVRGFVVDTIYAEHNKFCNIYYNNWDSPAGTVTKYVDIRNVYFWNDASDLYFQNDVYMSQDFLPPTVSFPRIQPNVNFPDCYSPDIDMARSLARKTRFNGFYGRSGNSYKVTLTVMPVFADNSTEEQVSLVFQNMIQSYAFYNNGTYDVYAVELTEEERIPAFGVPLVRGEAKTFSYYVTLPNRQGAPLIYKPATYTTGEADWYLIDGKVENVTVTRNDTHYGKKPDGVLDMGDTDQGERIGVWDNGVWKGMAYASEVAEANANYTSLNGKYATLADQCAELDTQHENLDDRLGTLEANSGIIADNMLNSNYPEKVTVSEGYYLRVGNVVQVVASFTVNEPITDEYGFALFTMPAECAAARKVWIDQTVFFISDRSPKILVNGSTLNTGSYRFTATYIAL